MANTRIQVEVEKALRTSELPRRYNQAFTQKAMPLTWGGTFVVDGVSEDESIVVCISTACWRTATGAPASGKYHKIRSDALFLMHIDARERVMAFTDQAMCRYFLAEQREKKRFPPETVLTVCHLPVPEHLATALRLSSVIASGEVTPAQ